MSVFIGYPSFMAYQMMKGKKGNNDGFPSIPGMIARYSALGLTNEQMAANPVWVDKTGNGHDIQLKNFSWKGMSGVGGVSTYYDKYEFTPDKYYMVAVSSGTQHAQFTFKVTGLVDSNTLSLADTSSPSNVYGKWTQDGIYTVDIDVINTDKSIYFYNGVSAIRGEFTIEILPLYPGFILGDGVDDFAVTEKELNFEDTYTVYTAFIPFQGDLTRAMALCGKNRAKDFYLYYISSLASVGFFSADKTASVLLSKGFNLIVSKRTSDKMVIKSLITGKSAEMPANALIDNPGLYYLWRSATIINYAKAAIAGQTICNGYFSTDEDDEKVLNWYKKQYPWLFSDQAWTVVGKTNEDEDRATIANITGNGNNLVLSNFGFAEGSGYGLYAENYAGGRWVQSTDRADLTWTSYSVNITSVKVASTQLYYQSYPEQPSFTVPSYKIKVYGLKDGQTLSYKQVISEGQQIYKISEDGTYTLPSFPFKANGDWYGFTLNKVQDSCDITIEQIPEYEGYLITDGVDDKVKSSPFTLNKDWTIVGNWTMLSNIPSNCGIIKVSSMFLYNSLDGVTIYFVGGPIKIQSKSINAFCSDGRIYLNDWTEILKPDVQIVSGGSKSGLNIASYSTNFTKMAFKNLAIYDGKNLSKDDCIKAYNYLQTLKAK